MIDKTKVCRLFATISDKLFDGMKPPADIAVKAKLKASNNLMSTKVYKKIIKIVDIK